MNCYSTTNKGHPLYTRKHSDMPLLIMMCGLPGSGKSRYAESIYVATPTIAKPVIHSSDKLRAELFGDEATQKSNNKLFAELHRRIKNDLINGKDVIYDATNIKKKKRIHFLKELHTIRCFPVCVVMATEYKACLFNNSKRKRVVPDDVIKRMQCNWTPPHYNEEKIMTRNEQIEKALYNQANHDKSGCPSCNLSIRHFETIKQKYPKQFEYFIAVGEEQ